MLRFSVNLSLIFQEMALLERIQAARDYGFRAVEIQFPYQRSAAEIQQALQQSEVEMAVFNIDAGDLMQGGEGLAAVPDKKDQFECALAQAVDYAEQLRPECVNVLPGCSADRSRSDEYLQTLNDNLRMAADAFAPLGVKCVVEAVNVHDMPGFLINNECSLLDRHDQVNHPNLFIQYDIYHMQRMGSDPAAFISAHAARIGHIQFADLPGRGQPGCGEIDFETLFQAIDETDYRGWLGAEYHPDGPSGESFGWYQAFRE